MKLAEFDQLSQLTKIDISQGNRLNGLRNYFAHSPKYLSPELLAKLQEIELRSVKSKNKK